MCNGRDHNLKAIFGSGSRDERAVVRWCLDCGSVVVDLDVDGRTSPGYYKKMLTPRYDMEKK